MSCQMTAQLLTLLDRLHFARVAALILLLAHVRAILLRQSF